MLLFSAAAIALFKIGVTKQRRVMSVLVVFAQ